MTNPETPYEIADYEDEDQEVGYPKRLREVQMMLESLAHWVSELADLRARADEVK